MKNLFEVYLTSENVEKEDWLKLFIRIGKINGRLRKWRLWISIENNYIRYFIEMKRSLPPVLGELGSFLFKKSDMKLKEKAIPMIPFFLTRNCKTVIDVYDTAESKRMHKLKKVKITFFPHKFDSYLSSTKLYFKGNDNTTYRRKLYFNCSIFEFVSIDFSTHTRFFYKKEVARYLETKKTLHLLSQEKEKSLLKADVFPYMQDELYLRHNDFDFDKHSIVIGASGTGKSKLISSMVKNLLNDNYNKPNYKVVIIDPHAAIEEDIGGLDGVRTIDFKTEEDSINLFVNRYRRYIIFDRINNVYIQKYYCR